MYPWRRILIPTDFSTASEWAFDDAIRIAGSTSAELLILHIRMTRISGDHPDRAALVVVVRLFVLVAPIVFGGCFLVSWLPWLPERGAPGADSGPVVQVEGCATCHAESVGQAYAAGVHSAVGLHCGQCHAAGNHPDFTRPVRDATCGGCHQPQFQQTLESKHFATRVQRVLDGDRAARSALRREGFRVAAAGGGKFAGDTAAGALGGRLCAACHFDEHRLGLRAVRQTDFCVGCHGSRAEHFPVATSGPPNRCVTCHVRAGESVTGQVVNTHRFAVPGG